MASTLKSDQLKAIDRRRFLSFAAVLPACAGVAGVQGEPSPEVIRLGPPERPGTDIEGCNLGLITAYRPEFSPPENQARNRELWSDLARFCGRLLVRGRYIENRGVLDRRTIEVEAFLVFGNPDDSGNLKGLLRKIGRRYGQGAVIHKPYYRDVQLYALADLPGFGMSDRDIRSLGRFCPDFVGSYLTLMIRQNADLEPFANFGHRSNAGCDQLGGQWEEINFWAYWSGPYPKRSLRRVYLDDSGIHNEN